MRRVLANLYPYYAPVNSLLLHLIISAALLFVFIAAPIQAQSGQCGVVTAINYPIDTNTFQLVQDFGTANTRHQGRYHTGEDWFGGHNSSLGQPVRAAAAGRVTYSSPQGWGRDGGVIIIEHTLPDGEVFYTQYGHIVQTDTVTFPTRLSCVQAGDIIAVIGDARPAPHVHFEVRVNNPDIPGPGYSREDPHSLGWRRPAQTIANIQARLHPAYQWHVTNLTYGPEVPPLVLDDHSLLVIDGDRLRRISPDGRVLWRVLLDRPAVSITRYQGSPLITFADGSFNRVDLTGATEETWRIDGFAPDAPPLSVDDSLLFHTADNALVALTPDRRGILWRLDAGIPVFTHAHVSGSLTAFIIETELWLLTRDGTVLSRTLLRNGADMATMPDGTLLVYTQGGLWYINAAGEWSQVLENPPPGGGSSAAAVTSDGRIYLTDGEQIYAYSRIGAAAWQARLPQPLTGRVSMRHYNNVLLITSSHGQIIALRDTGGICGFTSIYGDDRAKAWHNLGSDRVLRVNVGDQMLGLNWQRFTSGC